MTTQLLPYLMFNGNCREAMNFYKDAIGGELKLSTIGESPSKDKLPVEKHNNVMHSALVKNGQMLIFASDMMGPDAANQGNTITLCLNCSSEDEIQTVFKNLAVDGTVISELKKEFWGDTFGMLVDKYGFNWMLNYGTNATSN